MTIEDIGSVLRVASQSANTPQWPRDAYETAIALDAALPRIAVVAEVAGEIAGFAVASVAAGEAELESIAVVSNAQRQGLAKALLNTLIADLQASGVKRLVLEVRESNTPARRLYEATGFEETGRRREYYHSPAEDALLFEQSIS